jgi:alpha-L-fucosidase
VEELSTNYGKVDILWYDGGEDNWLGHGGIVWTGGQWRSRGFDKPYTGSFSWEPVKLNTMVRALQPKAVISERSGWMGDFSTRENAFGKRPNRPWEFCTNLSGGAWGWTPQAKHQVLSLDTLIQLLAKVACMDGNLLLNVGPRSDGEIEETQVQRLRELGNFLKKYGESIYGTRGGIYDDTWGGTTLSEKAVYVHVLKIPSDGKITVPAINQKIAHAVIINNNAKIKVEQTDEGIKLVGLSQKEKFADTIIRLSFR